jgi:hypothetical protein
LTGTRIVKAFAHTAKPKSWCPETEKRLLSRVNTALALPPALDKTEEPTDGWVTLVLNWLPYARMGDLVVDAIFTNDCPLRGIKADYA